MELRSRFLTAAICAVLTLNATVAPGQESRQQCAGLSQLGLDYYSQGGIVQNGIAYFTANDSSRRNEEVAAAKRDESFPCVVAFSLDDYTVIRRYPIQKTYDSTPMVIRRRDGTWLLLAHEHQNSRTVAVNRDTAEVVWTSEANQPGAYFFAYSYYQCDDGTKLILTACRNGLHAMSLETGKDRWWCKVADDGGITPCVDQRRGWIFYQCRGKVLKLRALDGKLLKQAQVGKPDRGISWNTVLIDDAHGYFVATRWYGRPAWDAAIRVFDKDLNLVWGRTKLPSGKKDTLTYAEGKLVSGCGNMWYKEGYEGDRWKNITAYEIGTGEVAWRCDLSQYDFTCSINQPYFNGHFYAETQDTIDKKSRLFRINAADGTLEEVYEYGRPITSCAQPLIARGRMLSGDLHRDRIVVTRLAENSTADWPGAFGDPQTHQNAVVDPNARRVPMEEIQKAPPGE